MGLGIRSGSATGSGVSMGLGRFMPKSIELQGTGSISELECLSKSSQ